jgi:hypothetical protein
MSGVFDVMEEVVLLVTSFVQQEHSKRGDKVGGGAGIKICESEPSIKSFDDEFAEFLVEPDNFSDSCYNASRVRGNRVTEVGDDAIMGEVVFGGKKMVAFK